MAAQSVTYAYQERAGLKRIADENLKKKLYN